MSHFSHECIVDDGALRAQCLFISKRAAVDGELQTENGQLTLNVVGQWRKLADIYQRAFDKKSLVRRLIDSAENFWDLCMQTAGPGFDCPIRFSFLECVSEEHSIKQADDGRLLTKGVGTTGLRLRKAFQVQIERQPGPLDIAILWSRVAYKTGSMLLVVFGVTRVHLFRELAESDGYVREIPFSKIVPNGYQRAHRNWEIAHGTQNGNPEHENASPKRKLTSGAEGVPEKSARSGDTIDNPNAVEENS